MAVARRREPQIRPLCLEDLDEVCRIERECFPCPWSREAFRRELEQHPYCACFALCLGPRLVGYAVLWILYEQAHLLNIAVDAPHRGKGYGESLLRHVLRYAAGLGADSMHLEVRESNEAAVSLYEKYGFQILGRQEGYYSDGAPALMMLVHLRRDRSS